MRYTNQSDFTAARLVDEMIQERFGRTYAVTSLPDYWDLVHSRSTAHLDPGQSDRIRKTTGAQHRNTRFVMEGDRILALVPLMDVRGNDGRGRVVYAKLWATTLFNLIECGADTKWFIAYKSKTQKAPQVRCKVPFGGAGEGPTNATIARLIVGARKFQQARTLDGDPLNLRTENIVLTGNPGIKEERVGKAKADTRAVHRHAIDVRASFARRRDGDDQ